MHFYVSSPTDKQVSRKLTVQVEGQRNRGVAQLHMIKHRGHDEFLYKYFFVDIEGNDRIYLEQDATGSANSGKKLSFFGVKWG